MDTQILAYKGFDKDLKCLGFQYVIGEEYYMPEEDLRVCAKGFHYCDKLENVFSYYPFANGNGNRFCEIQVLGKVINSGDKSVTNRFKILNEIKQVDIYDRRCIAAFKLDVIRKMQTMYPMMQIGGSTALFLHGVKLKRFADTYYERDMDVTIPYYICFQGDDSIRVELTEERVSGSDYDYTLTWNGTKVDVRIDSKSRYEIVEFNGFKYNVVPLETIIEAKAAYAKKGNQKHKDDLRELCRATAKNVQMNSSPDDLPF